LVSAPVPSPSWTEQHPCHHLLRIFQFDRIGFAQPHGALNPFGAEMQITHAVGFGQRDRRVFDLARGGGFGRSAPAGAVPGVGVGFDRFSSD
jgi:hypothetical protein